MCSCPEDEIIQLSAVQHVAFCERQCYLIHVEQIWSENFFTVSGSLSHQRVDSEETTYTADGLKQVRSLLLNSAKYGLSGRADLIEFDSAGRAYPVEYKIGRPKLDDCEAFSFARRRSVWRRCCTSRFPAEPFITGAHVSGWSSN